MGSVSGLGSLFNNFEFAADYILCYHSVFPSSLLSVIENGYLAYTSWVNGSSELPTKRRSIPAQALILRLKEEEYNVSSRFTAQ